MFTRSQVSLALAAAVTLPLLAGCSNAVGDSHAEPAAVSQTHGGSGRIQAVATTGMVADLVKNVGDSHIEVTTLMGEGVDPHLYLASPADVARLDRADIIFYSGWHLEGKLADLLARMSRRKTTVAVAEKIDESRILHDEENAHDPHVWFDVSLWSEAALAVRDALVAYDPPHAEEYRANSEAYQARLAKLHQYAKEQLATIPKEQRVLVTAHDAFRYFGRAYDMEVRGIQGISTDSEAGVRQVNDLVDFLVERKIKAVFVESSVSDQNVKSLIEGAAAQKHSVAIGGELFSDAMGAEDTPEGTYEGMVRHNVDTIVNALK
jgi:manganese/zinc/iron transport system substrate-binding protein